MSAVNPATPPLRVLFVEDNDDLREIIGILLEEEGLDVCACGTAEDAEELFSQRQFDMVLTDVSLPKMSGTELAKRLLATAPGTWIVFSTGYSLERGLEAWGPTVRVLPKPFEVEDLQALLGEIRAVRA